jgi:hypothetical protein
MSPGQTSLRIVFCLLSFLCFPGETRAQQPPLDAAEVSRDLLYQPAYRIETGAAGVVFRGERFIYRFYPASSQWEVRREKNFVASQLPRAVLTYRHEASGNTYRLVPIDSDDEGILEIRPLTDMEGEALVRLRLWTRQQLASAWFDEMRTESRELTEQRLRDELEVAEPEVAAVVEEGGYLWLAIRHYAGEGFLGLGMIVRFDPNTNEARVFRSPELDTASVTHIAAAGGKLWLGTMREGEGFIGPAAGLVRFDPASGEFQFDRPGKSAMVGNIVTALRAEPEFLWVATDAGMCRVTLASEGWQCWRVVPVVQLAAPVPVSSQPGGAPRGELPAGTYEVRWATLGNFEVVTPDAMEGWLDPDDFREYSRRQFDARAFELGNTYGGGAGVMRLLDEPEGDPLAASQVFRAPLERAGAPDEDGWLPVRARVGWIRRDNLEVTVQIQPAQ